jgi:hypothetical protein
VTTGFFLCAIRLASRIRVLVSPLVSHELSR